MTNTQKPQRAITATQFDLLVPAPAVSAALWEVRTHLRRERRHALWVNQVLQHAGKPSVPVPETTGDTLIALLHNCGFTTTLAQRGGVRITGYDGDYADSEGVLRSLAPHVRSRGFIEWRDATDDAVWRSVFFRGRMTIQEITAPDTSRWFGGQ